MTLYSILYSYNDMMVEMRVSTFPLRITTN
jgi:hypothetical protein